jgi:hypothetical protein
VPVLADNGGPTLSVALVPGSPALDMVPFSGCLPEDQRGFPRPGGGACDAGAFELQGGGSAGLGGDGPGGVGHTLGASDLRVWLRGDSGIAASPVALWEDRSGYGNDAGQATSDSRPTLQTSALNGAPALAFDGVDDHLETGAVPALDTTTQTIFVVGSHDNTDANVLVRSAYSSGTSNTSWYNQHLAGILSSGGQDSAHARSDTGGYVSVSAAADTAGHLHAFQWDGSDIAYWRDGALAGTSTGATASPGGHLATVIGRNYGGSLALAGQIAEVIIFDRALITAQVNLVNNYLSARYDLPLAASDYYTGDDAANGDFDWDAAGIGREGDGSHTEGHSAGLIVQDVDFLQDDGDYLMVGHDGARGIVTTDWTGRRWERVWSCTKTDAGTQGGSVNLIFDFGDAEMAGSLPGEPASSYRLLKRDGTSGAFTEVATATAVVGDRVIFEGVEAAGLCSTLTLGAVDGAPLAVSVVGLGAAGNVGWVATVTLAVVGLILVRRKARK